MGLCISNEHSRGNANGKLTRSIINEDKSIPFVPPITSGKVIKVYDGDTITITSKLPYKSSPLYKFRVRLAGIDSPEIKGESQQERDQALKSKEFLESLILNKNITLENVSNDKYGRVLATVYIGNKNVNEEMIKNKHAVHYDGGTKQSYDEKDYD